MVLSQLTAISPVDGRYRGKCEALDNGTTGETVDINGHPATISVEKC